MRFKIKVNWSILVKALLTAATTALGAITFISCNGL